MLFFLFRNFLPKIFLTMNIMSYFILFEINGSDISVIAIPAPVHAQQVIITALRIGLKSLYMSVYLEITTAKLKYTTNSKIMSYYLARSLRSS